MDNQYQKSNAEQLRAERRKRAATQRYIRIAAIAVAIILSIASLLSSCSTKKAVDELAAQLQAKKAAQAQQALLEEQAANASDPDPTRSLFGKRITLSFLGDLTLCSEATANSSGSFEDAYVQNGAPYFFENVRSILEGDDLTVANLECCLTNSDTSAYVESHYRADPSYVSILNNSGIDALCTANDHTQDYSSAGYVDTLATLDVAGLTRFGAEFISNIEVQGIKVGLTAVDTTADDGTAQELLLNNINRLTEDGAQIIVCYINWGTTEDTTPSGYIRDLAHAAIDAGADLIIGVNPRALQGIERYKDRHICYSLGRFCNGKESQLDYWQTMIFQQTFELDDGKVQSTEDYQIIPCSMTSSGSEANNYRPALCDTASSEQVLGSIYDLSRDIDGGITRPVSAGQSTQGSPETPAATEGETTEALTEGPAAEAAPTEDTPEE